ncbi:MAG: AAA family ATPase [Acidobacteriota bacterium]|nr:AAA family ATPase [Acidobacteriota bacterium]
MRAKLPIGISDFSKLIRGGYAYVDKTRFISRVLAYESGVLLLPRPRRFGKTLNLSMLRYFFEQDHEDLFKGLAVTGDQEAMSYQGSAPVVFLTFKDIKGRTFEKCRGDLSLLVSEEYQRHADALRRAELTDAEREQVDALLGSRADASVLGRSLLLLTRLLHRAYGREAVVLIDEYDTPIHAGYRHDYYDEIIDLMRGFLGAGLKDNPFLAIGVVTGILRIAPESIFSDLNNLNVFSILYQPFADCFGFTEDEVAGLLRETGHEDLDLVRMWYNGYLFGEETVYNPWSILQYAQFGQADPYWVNTSGNELIRDLIMKKDALSPRDLETLLSGGSVEASITDHIMLRDIRGSAVWSLLAMSGYLHLGPFRRAGAQRIHRLRIPNMEVTWFYEHAVTSWLDKRIEPSLLQGLGKALADVDMDRLEQLLSGLVLTVLSYHDLGNDESERVYQAFILGLLVHLNHTYRIRSDRESGKGRYDAALFPREPSGIAFLLEFKKAEDDLDAAVAEALNQIRDRDYAAEARDAGASRIMAVGIGIRGKTLRLKGEEL